MKVFIGVAVLAAVLVRCPAVRAQDDAAIKERIKAAAASTRSVVVDMEMSLPASVASQKSPDMRVMLTIATPARSKSVAIFGPVRVETYAVDGMLYMHVQPGDSWRKMRYDPTRPPQQVTDLLRAAKNERITLLPDRREGGVTIGVAQIDVAMPAPAGTASVGPPVAMTCDYDKATFHILACANQRMSMTFAKYNDPSIAVELPPDAARAVLVVTKTPAPAGAAPSPAPDASPPVPSPGVPEPPMPTPTPAVTPSGASPTPIVFEKG